MPDVPHQSDVPSDVPHQPEAMLHRRTRLSAVQKVYAKVFVSVPDTPLNAWVDGSAHPDNLIADARPIDDQDQTWALVADPDHAQAIADATTDYSLQVENLIAGALPEGGMPKIPLLVLVILRTAVAEMILQEHRHVGPLMKDYVTVAAAFFESKQVGFVHAVLDSVARRDEAGDQIASSLRDSVVEADP